MKQLSRRDFLKVSFTAGGALLISTYLESCAPSPTEEVFNTTTPTSTPTPISQPSYKPNLFIRIAPDGILTFIIHRSEMGQGVRTSLSQMIAEELEADWSKVRVEQMDAVKTVNQATHGSESIFLNYDNLRRTGAKVRMMLVGAAAQHWDVPEEECRAENSEVIHDSTSQRIGYGELVPIVMELDPTVNELDIVGKDPGEFKLIGTSLKRIDDPDIVTGKAVFGLDVRVPDMLFAVVAHPPVVGGALLEYDAAEAESVPGVRGVVEIPTGVAVIADNTWAAIQGRSALKISWDESLNETLSSESIIDSLAARVQREVDGQDFSAFNSIEAVYETPFLAHATIEPVNCLAHVRSDECELWIPTQNPQEAQTHVGRALGLPVTVHVTLLGGGFGRKLEVDYPLEAAEISKAFGLPIQLVFTREDDMQHDFYRQATYHWMKAGWDKDGNVSFWKHYIAGQGIKGIAYRAGQEVLNQDLSILYDVDGRDSRPLLVDSPVPTGPWRGVVSATNAFANECFFDELAAALGRDPYEFRAQHLSTQPRQLSALELAAEKAGWGTPLAENHGRGIACHTTYGQTAVAMVADVSVIDNQLRIHKVTCAINCGQVVNPDMVAQQLEGSIVYGLSTLKGGITFKNGRVQQSNFNNYPLLQLSEMPDVEVHIVNDESRPRGLGEMGVPPIVPAVLNAVFDATGIRIRHTPIQPGELEK